MGGIQNKKMNTDKIRILTLYSLILLLQVAKGAESLQPPASLQGPRLIQFRQEILDGAISAGRAGAGIEAANLLIKLSESGTDSVSGSAKEYLTHWKLDRAQLAASSPKEVSQRIKHSLEMETQAKIRISMIGSLLAFGDIETASQYVGDLVSTELRIEIRQQAQTELLKLAIAAKSEWETLAKADQATLKTRIIAGQKALRHLQQAEFLIVAEPSAGASYMALLQEAHPLTEEAKKTREAARANNRGRFGFPGFGPGRGMPPGMANRFGGRFGFRGNRNEEEAPSRPEPKLPTFDQFTKILASLAHKDRDLAHDLAELGLAYFKDSTEQQSLTAQIATFPITKSNKTSNHLITERFQKTPKPGKAASIFEGKQVPTYQIDINEENLAKLKNTPNEYVSATFRSDDKTLENVGVRLKGGIGSFRPLEGENKVGLMVKFNKFVEGQKFLGLKRMVLNNSVQDGAYLREGLGYALIRKAGLPAPRVGNANVVLNGTPYGLYVQVEAVPSRFLKRWFGDGDGDLYEGAYGTDITDSDRLEIDSNPETLNRARLRALAEAAEKSIQERSIKPFDGILDTLAFSRYLALEFLMDHWDGYVSANNYRLYLDPKTDQFYFLPHGMDQLFRNYAGDLYRSVRGIVAQAILETPDGWELYMQQVEDLMANVLTPEIVQEYLQPRYELVRPHVLADPQSPNSIDQFEEVIQTTIGFFPQKQRLLGWQKLAFDDTTLANRIQSLNQGRGGFNRGRR